MKSIFPRRIGSVSPYEALTRSSHKQRTPSFPKENIDPNTMPPESAHFKSPTTSGKSPAPQNRSPLPPRPPPSSNRPKRKLSLETLTEYGCTDCGVQVIVRMRPLSREEEGVRIVQKTSPISISVMDHNFTFDSVADEVSTQHDIFELVGLPLVENCLAGFNSSIFAYGQTGSGKTYTMWGAPNSLMADCTLNQERGLTPRVFEQLFFRINEEQTKHSDKQLHFQCHCSFLEIYNEQITDLLEPTHKNLQIREDVKTGIYVDCLKKEYVSTTNDVIQLLIRGLANRRIGATSINIESSRSHCVFTCIVDCRSKNMTNGLISLRTSRINLVDLAGSERQKATGAAGERLKEAGSINRSLSQLGNLINILAEVSQSGKHRHIPYRDSRLTFLLQESLGGNAKLAMICNVSPSNSCKSETLSTLRFAQRAKEIRNKATVNETTEDDANVLREQIQQLKDELLRMKSNGKSEENNGSCSSGWNVRRSLSLLRFSLCRPRTLPVEDDSDEEMEIVEEGVENSGTEANSPTVDGDNSNVKEELTKFESFNEQNPCYLDKETSSGDACFKKIPGPGSECHQDSECRHCNEDHEEIKELAFPTPALCMNEQIKDEYEPKMIPAKRKSLAGDHDEITEGSSLIVKEELTKFESFNEQNPCYLDKETSSGDVCFKKIPGPGSECHQDSECRHCSEDHEEIKELAFPTPVLCMNEQIKDEDEPQMIPAKRKSLAGDHNEITEGSSLIFRVPSNETFLDPSQNLSGSPTFSVSPRNTNYSRKSARTSSSTSASHKSIKSDFKPDSGILNVSFSGFLNEGKSSISFFHSSKDSLAATENLAVSLCQGLQVISGQKHNSSLSSSSFRFSSKPVDMKPLIIMDKVDIGTQTLSDEEPHWADDASVLLCDNCRGKALPLENNDVTEKSGLQIALIDGSQSSKKPRPTERGKKQVPKAMEKVLAGAIRREMALEDRCSKQAAEIMHLNRLIQQYKHERGCIEIIEQAHEDKISRLESLMDGVMPTEEFMEKELLALRNEYMILKEKYENHPEVLQLNIELKKVQNELDDYRNFFDMGEKDVLLEEIQDLRQYLQCCVDSSYTSNHPLLELAHSMGPALAPLSKISDTKDVTFDENIELKRRNWTDLEKKWISSYKELKIELEACQSLAEKLTMDLESEKKCSQELKEALQTALQVHTKTLEHYADLEEKHMALLQRHRKMREGILNVKKVAASVGVRRDSKFVESMSAQIEALREERQKERMYWRDENKGLQTQLRDTAEAVLAAGELLTRLNETEAAAANAKKSALFAERKTEKAYQEIDEIKKKYESQIATLKQLLVESHSTKEGRVDEFSSGTGHNSWLYGYDQCNI
ncbi:kinesin-like protein KIN-12A isoform X2 [Phalaenopsis equestris]|uniref:kinesin-like protein KIN-12A isoform X2 n=1 Tax=Phalaenopsis equestris TaxID=78828 RepID=UPI0009E4D5B9|nr:kinesin-like protein KIN-12A isoform X2 [Phalaenopsis equestris]